MADTPFSLLERLARGPAGRDWEAFVALYDPVHRGWLRRHLTNAADPADLVQDVFRILVERLPDFQHNGAAGAFRARLRAILATRLRFFWRTRSRRPASALTPEVETSLADLEDPTGAVALEWDREHDRLVIARLLDLVRYAMDGATAEDAARELGLSVNAVCIAKSPVLRRLREEAAGCWATERVAEDFAHFCESGRRAR